MRILRHNDDSSPSCWNMKSARPQILLLEDLNREDLQEVPTDDDIAEYARALGINTKDEEDLVWIARDGLNAPLPADWRAVEDQPSGQIYYFNVGNGAASWEHPMDSHYRKQVEVERQNRLRKKCVEEPTMQPTENHEGSTRPKSPYNLFRQPSPTQTGRFERPSLRPRSPVPNLRAPNTTLLTPPPWSKTTATASPNPSLPPTPVDSPAELRKIIPNVNSDGVAPGSPDTSSNPFNRAQSPNATLAETKTLVEEKPRASEPFHNNNKPPPRDEKPPPPPPPHNDKIQSPLERKPSIESKFTKLIEVMEQKASMEKDSTALTSARRISLQFNHPEIPGEPRPADNATSAAQTNAQRLREEEEKMKKEHDLALNNIRERLAKERIEEEKRLRTQMAEEIRIFKGKMDKEKEAEEANIRLRSMEDLRVIKEVVQRDKEKQEQSIREAVKVDLQKLKDQLDAERNVQERALRNAMAEDLKKMEENLRKEQIEKQTEIERKELDQLKRSMESEIAELLATHRKRVEELRSAHQKEIDDIEKNIARLRHELDRLEMEVADESAIKKTQIESLERQKASVEQRITGLRNQEAEIRAQCDSLTDELKKLTKDSKLNERVMTRLEQQRNEMEEDLYMLKRAKQRYVERVEQLKQIVGESFSPLSLASDEAWGLRMEENTDVPADVNDIPEPTTPLVEISTPLDDETFLPPTPEPNHLPEDDLSRTPTPEPRSHSPSFFRRLSSRNENGSVSDNRQAFLTARKLLRDLLVDEECGMELINVRASVSPPVDVTNLSLDNAAATKNGRHGSSLTSDYVISGTLNHHPSPFESDLVPRKTSLTARTSLQSPTFDPEKIDNHMTPRSDDPLVRVYSDPSYILQNQLDAIKAWVAKYSL
ncbi:hypothetical protein RvY_14636-2 [Ramazzottius varieornatus]|uniref:WW domain-containing protein n=1 Tax=Ramazzottius varieornatus TaxID=947166 RepID=A0A1D1VS39_RAMVA|nr:hypothetical protein RvY_14636-2 [Ramazzottius varieornatus]